METNPVLAPNVNPPTWAARLYRGVAAPLLLWLLLALPAVVQAQYTYTTNSNQITITGYTGAGGAVTIPEAINGLPITKIGDGAFAGRTSLTSVTIPNSVTSLGDRAFGGCFNLTAINVNAANPAYSSVDGVLFNKSQTRLIECPPGKAGNYMIPNSVTNIGCYAFYNCYGLTNVTIGNSVTTFWSYAFFGCTGLSNVTIPNSVTTLGNGAFYFCSGLTNVTIPNSVTTLGSFAFESCTRLTSVTIPNSVTTLGGYMFVGCSSLTAINVDAANSKYSSVDGVLLNKSRTSLIQFPPGKVESYTIPDSVTSIGDSAFDNCPNLTSFTIPNSVTTIGSFAFGGCRSLTNVTIGNRVTTLGLLPFGDSFNLTAINVDAGNSEYSSVDGVLLNKSGTSLIEFPQGKGESYTIPNSLWKKSV